MKFTKILSIALAMAILTSLFIAPVASAKKSDVNTITEGEVYYSAGHYLEGEAIPTGYDAYGYNYQAHMFKGSYFNAYSGKAGFPAWEGDDEAYLAENPDAENHWAWPYRETRIIMKWNDAWLSNQDRDLDGALDRHYGFDSYVGSGAWETNHQFGTNEDGTNWNYFCKIVAVPADATLADGYFYTVDGVEIGPEIWGEFATIQEVYNDPTADSHGLVYLSPNNAGLGSYMP